MAGYGVGELFRLVLAERSEEARERLAAVFLEDVEQGLEAIARRVSGEALPDTIVARTALEIVLAAAAYAWKEGKRLRVMASSEPIPGWRPLNQVLAVIEENGIVEVYRLPLIASAKSTARDIARRVARLVKGISSRVVDVSDAPPYIVAGLYTGGVRTMTVLVDLGHIAVFQKFGFYQAL
ncbi:MAG TPA: hypothetical protein EYH50_00160 [Pyrodictium delaneyi]|uniref:Uncharacterized protein n=1 Tax=Pyrodictium delaneyi TaxID=1273541 RepID=A0A832ZS51_9CREN|nr:hypothetical protein [Pyrodictium delaneyi]